MQNVILHHFLCPYCNAPISMQLELLYGNQEYIEDCEVCCQPIKISYSVSQDYQLDQFRCDTC